MTRLADGDRAAFHGVYALIWPLVRRFASQFLPIGDAEEAAQDALIKVFLRASEFDPSREALPWILVCVAFECRTAARRAARRRLLLDNETPLLTDNPTPEHLAITRELEQALRKVLGTLSPLDQGTILAVMEERESRGGAIFRKRFQRALARLRDAWRLRHGLG